MFACSIVILLSWLIFLSYWIANWEKVKPAKFNKSHKDLRSLVSVLVIMVALAVFKNLCTLLKLDVPGSFCSSEIVDMKNTSLFGVLGTILSVSGLLIAISARRTLGRNWAPKVELKKDHELVTDGIYLYVRHPIYLGMSLMSLGTLLVSQSWIVFCFFLYVIKIFVSRIKEEEQLMLKTFPETYPRYKKHSKALIPFVY